MQNSPSTDFQALAISDLEHAVRREWGAYVIIARATSPESVTAKAQELSEKLHIGKDSIARRLAAIQFAFANKLTLEQIVDDGQEQTLSAHIKSRKAENAGKTVKIGYQIPGELKQLFDEEMERVRRVANLVTPEQFFEWLVNVLHQLSDEDIKHSAGGKDGA